MTCPQCHGETKPGAKFCSECGTKLPAVCPHCGAELTPNAKVCAECGTAVAAPSAAAPVTRPRDLAEQFGAFQRTLPASVHQQIFTQEEGENRVLTILFADLSGSTVTIGALAPEDAARL